MVNLNFLGRVQRYDDRASDMLRCFSVPHPAFVHYVPHVVTTRTDFFRLLRFCAVLSARGDNEDLDTGR